jgi:hypothetical protein
LFINFTHHSTTSDTIRAKRSLNAAEVPPRWRCSTTG